MLTLSWGGPLPLLEDISTVFSLGLDMLPTEKAGINRPRPRPDHGGRTAEGCQDDRHPRITDVPERHPQFHHSDQRSHEWGPETDNEKYPGAASDDVGEYHRSGRPARTRDDREANQQNGC